MICIFYKAVANLDSLAEPQKEKLLYSYACRLPEVEELPTITITQWERLLKLLRLFFIKNAFGDAKLAWKSG